MTRQRDTGHGVVIPAFRLDPKHPTESVALDYLNREIAAGRKRRDIIAQALRAAAEGRQRSNGSQAINEILEIVRELKEHGISISGEGQLQTSDGAQLPPMLRESIVNMASSLDTGD